MIWSVQTASFSPGILQVVFIEGFYDMPLMKCVWFQAHQRVRTDRDKWQLNPCFRLMCVRG